MKRFFCLILVIAMCTTMPVSANAYELYPETAFDVEDAMLIQNERLIVYNAAWFRALRTGYLGYESHYNTNFAMESGMGYIYNQNSCPQFLIGNSTMANVGCEIAAVYNAIKLRGLTVYCSNIIRTFEKDNYLMTYGYLGSDPYAIGDYFDNNMAYSLTEYTDYDTFNDYIADNISTYNVYIVSYWNDDTISQGLHTVCFYTSGGNIYGYNIEWNAVGITTHESLLSFIEASDRFIVGYFVPRMGRIKP